MFNMNLFFVRVVVRMRDAGGIGVDIPTRSAPIDC